MIAIVATAADNGIGKNNDLLFNIPADKKFFRSMTVDHIVVMGRKTFQSLPFGKPLKDRTNVVLTNDPGFTAEGAIVCHGMDELDAFLADKDGDDVYVIGGAQVYAELLDRCDKAVVTKIEATADADKFFPDIDSDEHWQLTRQTEKQEHEGIKFSFCTYERI